MSRFTRFLSAVGGQLIPGLVRDTDAQAWRPTKGKNLELTYGAVGTLNFAGYLTDLGEYNATFKVNTEAFQVYEQMRRGDAQVFALLCTLSLPITSARWDVAAPEEQPKSLEKEAANLVRQNLFGGLEYVSPSGMLVSQSWTDVLNHALLVLPFGASAMEEIWEIDGDTIRLARLSPRMPSTYWRWHVDTDGETLMVLEQIAYRGANMEFWKTPADKLTLFNYQQEGAYFAGRALLRAAYPPWYFKNNLQKIEAIAAEHNGMGVPVGTHAPNADEEDRERFNAMLQRFAVHESASFGLPNGAKFELVGVAGKTFDCSAPISRYNQEITRVGLASFLDLGTSAGSSGSKALGGTLSDFFYLAEQSLANSIASSVTHACVRRIVDFNYPGKFGRGLLRYPHVTVANVQSRAITSVIEYLDKLARAEIIRPDDALEADIREQLGFAQADPTTARLQEQMKVTEAIQGQPPTAPGSPQPAGAATASTSPSPAAPAPAATPGAGKEPTTEALPAAASKNVREHAATSPALSRAPQGAELHVAHQTVLATLNGAAVSLASAIRAAKPAMLAEMAKRAAGATPGKVHQAAMPPLDKSLIASIRAKLDDVYQAGVASVEQERASQVAARPLPAASATKPAMVQMDATDDALQLAAETTVGLVQNQLGARTKTAALNAQRGGQQPAPQQIADDVDGQTDGWIDRAASEAAHQAFAQGRQDGFAAHRSEISRFIYSAMLDMNTCGECAKADGKEGQESELPEVPNPDCEGGAQCRCMWVAVFKDEGAAA